MTESDSAKGFLTNNMLARQTMVDEILFASYQLSLFIPINTNVPEGAMAYGVRYRTPDVPNKAKSGLARQVMMRHARLPARRSSPHLLHWYILDAEWCVD